MSGLLSLKGKISLAGSLMERGFEREGAVTTDPASEERESSWNVVGLMLRRDILYEAEKCVASRKQDSRSRRTPLGSPLLLP